MWVKRCSWSAGASTERGDVRHEPTERRISSVFPFRSEDTYAIFTYRLMLRVFVIMTETVVTLQPEY